MGCHYQGLEKTDGPKADSVRNLEAQGAAVLEIAHNQNFRSKRLGKGSPSSEESFTQKIK